MKKTRCKRTRVALAVVFVATLTITFVYATSFSPVLVNGVVDHKVVSGVNDIASRTLLVISPDGMLIKVPALAALMKDREVNLTVDETLDQKIHNLGYSKVLYLVSIRVDTSDPVNGIDQGETLQYYVSRDDFNRLTFDGSATFEVDKSRGATITRVLG